MKFSDHFEEERAPRSDRERITLELCRRARREPVHEERGRYGRTVYWARVEEADRVRYLRVVVEPDDYEVATASFDRTYRRKAQRGEMPR